MNLLIDIKRGSEKEALVLAAASRVKLDDSLSDAERNHPCVALLGLLRAKGIRGEVAFAIQVYEGVSEANTKGFNVHSDITAEHMAELFGAAEKADDVDFDGEGCRAFLAEWIGELDLAHALAWLDGHLNTAIAHHAGGSQ